MKKRLHVILAVIGVLGVAAMLVSLVLGIWTGDDRWLHTAVVALMLGFIGISTSFYPGWND